MKHAHFLLAFSLILFAGPLLGEEAACDSQESVRTCFDTLLQAAVNPAVEEKIRATKEALPTELGKKATSLNAPGNSRGLLDLLPSFASSVGIDGLNNTDGKLTLDRRFEKGQWRFGLNGTAYLNAELFEPLRAKLPEAIRETRTSDLSKDIGDFDKVDYLFTASREKGTGDKRFGRDPEDYADLFDAWVAYLQPFNHQIELNALLDRYRSALPVSEQPMLERKLADFDSKEATSIEADLRAWCTAFAASLKGFDKVTDRMDELINNQPQLLFEASFEDRTALTGPDKQGFRVSYEMGLAGNINKYLSWARKNVAGDCQGDAMKLSCLNAFLDDYPDAAKGGQRVVFALAYTDTRAVHFELPEDVFVFDQPEAKKWVGSLTYGRYFPKFVFFQQVANSTNQGTRVDFEAKYESPVESDKLLKDRLVATLSFTQGMTVNTGVSFSIIYANHAEFLGDVDHKVSANLGLRWKTGSPGS